MIVVRPQFRRIVQLLAIAGILIFAQSAFPQCLAAKEEGRWRNLDKNGDPSLIDIKMTGGCGDQVLNGQQTGTKTRYTVQVSVKQANGQYYRRQPVKAVYKKWNRQQWLQGNVPTGGYQDQMWMRAVEHDGRPHLHVVIRHQSLDSKPSSQSEYWFVR